MPEPVPVFLLSYERPLYLWASLDSLYRNTKYPCRFIIADNNSKDPLVRDVIEGFRSRGMFHAVHYCGENAPNRLAWLIKNHVDLLTEYLVYAETDILIQPSAPCWLSHFVRIMSTKQELGLLGSLIDPSDFISLEDAQRARPDIPEPVIFDLIKYRSPERKVGEVELKPIIKPFCPPGRLLMIRTECLRKVILKKDDELHRNMLANGYEAGISTDVVHRHLSLLNLFDYCDYDTKQRDQFFESMNSEQPVLAPENTP